MAHREEKVCSVLKATGAEFLARVTSKRSLITVTDCKITSDLKHATLFISVYPNEHEEEALNFAKRQRSELREILKEKFKTKTVPFVEIELDVGEKNRQKVDEIFRQLEDKK